MNEPTTADSAETIEALSDTLYDALYAITPFAEQHFADEREGLRNAVRAVLEQAAVPPTTNHDTDTSAETPLEKRLRFSERRNDDLRAECKRRSKRVLEQSEQILALERQVDEVQRQLGAEILRAGQAEAELRRVADEAAAPETQAECTASRTGACLREAESETACDTEAGECAHGGQPTTGARQDGAQPSPPA
ncbi:hypothetical protein OH540_09535 [Streptomyces sp. BPPL-273]|uniref:hypothetical protein n=1 Tax=Streptomyces sp. BPPL-273 TaxID=2987533 RepID=UPI0024AFC42D|nr:hypothetical protein [Streptomyces sp. BPPL-273]WHM30264.1 hypothetical protein OH540_09535 [Streptomyces sp. BPPL-273]